jgi:hypothetical protein
MKQLASAQSLALAAVLGSLTSQVDATPLPRHKVIFDVTASECHVDFLGDASSGQAPPSLRVTFGMLSERVSVALIGGVFLEEVFLFSDTRYAFRPIRSISPNRLQEDLFWLQLSTAAEQESPIYFTVRDDKNLYSSIRYDQLGPKQIARTVALACGAEMPEAIPESEIEALRAEERLKLTDSDVAHIRRILVSRHGEPGMLVGREARFTITDRRLISLSNADGAGPGSEYLTAERAAELLSAQVELPQQVPTPAGASQIAEFRDWSLWSERDDAVCSILSPVQTSIGYNGAIRPVMRFAVDRADSGGLMFFELTRPNPFASGAISANIDGQRVDLSIEPSTGALVPRPLSDGRLSNEFMVLMRQGSSITIDGTAIDTGQPLSLTYSALGFTAAFREMSRLCNRSGILGWIE